MGAEVAGTEATVGVMAVVKICERLVRARSVSLPTVTKEDAGAIFNSALARFLEERVDTSNEEGAGMTHWCGNNCTILATQSAQLFGT